MDNHSKIVIAGAGSIGCFVGGLLKASGHNVLFLGRRRIVEITKQYGLKLTDYTGMSLSVSPEDIKISDDPQILSDADIVLVTVKSSATKDIARLIYENAKETAIIVSLQNGVRNAEMLRQCLPDFDVRAGMVPFNVIQMENGRFHRGTSGKIVVEFGQPEIANNLNTRHLQTVSSSEMKSILWGKLLVNLNNALNALSGVPLVQQLKDKMWRRLLAKQMQEALEMMQLSGINPKPPSPVPAWLLPHILRLPTPLFNVVARQMLAIDPKARSSMWEDLELGRMTEIDELQGEIIKIAKRKNRKATVNLDVLTRIKEAEKRNAGSPNIPPWKP
ncbi:MAG: 2-dehydropantoate 2-reductase [Pseudomonadota bacterium]